MKEIIVIGTLHSNSTPHKELLELVEEVGPDKVFVELSPEELGEERRQNSIRDEMFAVYDWARDHKLPICAFDIENDILKEGVTGNEAIFQELEQKSKKILENYSWKELNEKAPWNIPRIRELEEELEEKYIDQEKSKERERQILENIKNELIEGKNLIITGAGHLSFFEKELPNAHFILRTNNKVG